MTKYKFSDTARTIIHYLQDNPGKNVTYKDIANEFGINGRSASSTITHLVRKGYAYREPIPDSDAKYVRLTSEGLDLDADQTVEE